MSEKKQGQLIHRLLEETKSGRRAWYPWRDDGTTATVVGRDVVVLSRGADGKRFSPGSGGPMWTDLFVVNERGFEVFRLTGGDGATPHQAERLFAPYADMLLELYEAAVRQDETPDRAVDRLLGNLTATPA